MNYSKLLEWSRPLSAYMALSGGVNAFGGLGRDFGRLGRAFGTVGGSGAAISPSFHRSYTVQIIPASATYYSFPGRVRPTEPLRTQMIIRNVGTTNLEFARETVGNNSDMTPNGAYSIVLTPGQEYAENGASTRMIFVRPSVSGQGGRWSCYVEMNGTVQNGVAATRAITPVSGGVSVINVSSYASASSARPVGLSKDGVTLYGALSTALKESTNDGTSFSTVHTFADPVLGLVETDDGEAICVTQAVATIPGKLYKSSGWTASHSAATWTLVLTSASNAFFRSYWGGANCATFGQDALNSSGKNGFATEYGPLLGSGSDATYPTHGYFTSDYGATWTMVLDLQAYAPTSAAYPMHIKAGVYDPWWDRLWATYDLKTDGTHACILYSDDHGTTWNEFVLPTEWQSVSAQFESNPIAVFQDRVIFGSDHTDGYYVLPRAGYRIHGTTYLGAVVSTHGTGSQQTNLATYRRNNSSQFFASVGGISGNAITPALIFADRTDSGASMIELWRDESLIGNGSGVQDVVGPTANGKFAANVLGNSRMLIGTVVQGVAGQYDQTVTFTGDGATTVYNFPHFITGTPSTKLAYPQNVGAVGASVPVVTADATNVILTFSVAPTNAVVHSYALRYA